MEDNTTAAPAIPEAPTAPEPSLLELAAKQSAPKRPSKPAPVAAEPDDEGEADEQEPDAGSDDETTAEADEGDDDGNPEADQPEGDDDDGGEEVEWEGELYRLPKGIKEAMLRQADYTRKTQEVAEIRRDAEATKEAVFKQAKFFESVGPIFSQYLDAQNKLEELDRKIDFRQLEAHDPAAAQSWWRYREQLKEYAGKLGETMQQTQSQMHLVQQQEAARRAETMHRVLSRDIKGWGQELNGKISEHAIRRLGFTPQEVERIDDPRVAKVLHKAWQYDQLMAKQKTQAKPAAKKDAVKVQPTAKISKGAPGPSGRKPIDKMSTAEYVEYMNRRDAENKRRDRDGRFR